LIYRLFILDLVNFLVDLIMPIELKHLWQFYKPILFINLVLSLAMSIQYFGYFPYVFMTVGYLCSAALVRFFEGNTKYLFFNLGLSRKHLVIYTFLANLLISFLLILIVHYGYKG